MGALRAFRRQTCLLLVLLSAASCSRLEPYDLVLARLPAANFLMIDGRSVYVERQGTGDPLVLIHGFGGSTYSWNDVADGLSASFDVIALDLNGFGYTQRPSSSEPYTLVGQMLLVEQVLDALAVEQAHIVGHSYGGAVAMLLAQERPERVRRLVLVDGGRAATGTGAPMALGPMVPACWSDVLAFALEQLALTPSGVRGFLEQSTWNDAVVTDELVDEYLKRLRAEGLADALRGLLEAGSAPVPEIVAARVSSPTLIIWGMYDEILPVTTGEALAEDLPNARLEIFEDSGHLPMHEEPGRFVQAVADFAQE